MATLIIKKIDDVTISIEDVLRQEKMVFPAEYRAEGNCNTGVVTVRQSAWGAVYVAHFSEIEVDGLGVLSTVEETVGELNGFIGNFNYGENASGSTFDGAPGIVSVARDRMIDGVWYPLVFTFSKPVPAHCHIQLYRKRKKKYRSGHVARSQIKVFVPVQISEAYLIRQNFPDLAVPEGSTVYGMDNAKIQKLYKPLRVRGQSRHWMDYLHDIKHNNVNMKRSSKVEYRFGLCEYSPGNYRQYPDVYPYTFRMTVYDGVGGLHEKREFL